MRVEHHMDNPLYRLNLDLDWLTLETPHWSTRKRAFVFILNFLDTSDVSLAISLFIRIISEFPGASEQFPSRQQSHECAQTRKLVVRPGTLVVCRTLRAMCAIE